MMKSKSPPRRYQGAASSNNVLKLASANAGNNDFTMARKRDTSHNRLLNSNSNQNLDLNMKHLHLNKNQPSKNQQPAIKQPVTSRKSQDAGFFSFFKGIFGEAEEPANQNKQNNMAYRGRVSQQTKASSSQSAALVAQKGFDGWSP